MERNYETSFITAHAQMRMKERLGIKNLDKMIRMAALAVERGIRVEDARESIAKRMISHETYDLTKVVLYNGTYFIFTDNLDTLVTVYPAGKKEVKWVEANTRKSNGYRKYNYAKDTRSEIEEELSFA